MRNSITIFLNKLFLGCVITRNSSIVKFKDLKEKPFFSKLEQFQDLENEKL
jgi:hypothetical protein